MLSQSTKNSEEEIVFEHGLFETDEKIEIATQTLDRNIDFVRNYDNKASFMSAIVGVILSIVFSEGTTVSMIKSLLEELRLQNNSVIVNFPIILYLIFVFLSLTMTMFGAFYLISVFYAQTKGSTRKSRIFFRGICEHEDYFQSFKTAKKHEILDDLIDQIKVNSQIALKKHKRYNIGFLSSIIGLFVFILLITVGMFSMG